MTGATPSGSGCQPTASIWEDASFVRRFWSKVQQSRNPDDCWPWRASGVRGRGRISIGGHMHVAPRIARVLTDRKWPDAAVMACHSCDNPACCNPAHIWWGSASDNARDAVSKGIIGQARDKCRNEHELTPENRLTGSNQGCRTCARERKTEWQRNRRKEMAHG